MAEIQVKFEHWVVLEHTDPDDDDDSFVYYFKLNDRWFKVTELSDFNGWESNLYQRDEEEIDFDPSKHPGAELRKKFMQTYRVPDEHDDPIAAIAAYKFWFRTTVYAGQTGWPKGVSRVKQTTSDELKKFLA